MTDSTKCHAKENDQIIGEMPTAMELPDAKHGRTLRLELPFGRTLGLAVVVFGLIVTLGEGLVRTRLFEAHVVSNNRGGRHGQFELQLGRLETVVARDGPIDCVVLGNSMVWHDFDPEAFAAGYRRQTGQDIRCFNFGVDGLPAVAAGAVAQVLVADFQPRLLIYGTTARDYALSDESADATVLLEMPWLQYRLGRFCIRGWLHEQSHLYQYRETLGQLLRLQGRDLLLTGYYASLKSTYGFYGRQATAVSVDAPPDPDIPGIQLWGLFELLDDYRLLPEAVSGLEQVMGQNGLDVQVVIVEMPIPPTYMHFFGDAGEDYQKFVRLVESLAETNAVSFWRTAQPGLIPDDGWYDYVYLNTKGARIFSEWLGAKAGSAVVQGKQNDLITEH